MFSIHTWGLITNNYSINQIKEDEYKVNIKGNFEYSSGVFPTAGEMTIVPISKRIKIANIEIKSERKELNNKKDISYPLIALIALIILIILIIILVLKHRKLSVSTKILSGIITIILVGVVIFYGMLSYYEFFTGDLISV